jgi:lipopolysaccharide transport system ATP-binding protein
MIAPVVSLTAVSLQYPIYSFKSRSIRYALANLSVGGKLMAASDQTVVVEALRTISLNVYNGDRLALVGPNGSGKSSLLRMIAGVYEPTRGQIQVNGRVSSMLDLSQGLDIEASGVENIKLLAAMRGHSPWRITEKIDEVAQFSELGAYLSMPVRVYSSGMIARLLFAVATSFAHDRLLLEEWLTAGDAKFVEKATDRMKDLLNSARVIITATHSESLVRTLCNKVLRLDHGEMAFFGDTDDYFSEFEWTGERK